WCWTVPKLVKAPFKDLVGAPLRIQKPLLETSTGPATEPSTQFTRPPAATVIGPETEVQVNMPRTTLVPASVAPLSVRFVIAPADWKSGNNTTVPPSSWRLAI